ncbi:MAG: sodium:proton antiporter [Lachnospiraceae bacterium]|nr:sodium:proton antiporter [Lachnospiraceae bacterium]
MNVLVFLIIILAFIIGIGILNERFLHMQSDIALILFSLLIALLIGVVSKFTPIPELNNFTQNIGEFGFEEYLMDGVLCFMLFAGASKVNMGKFKQNLRPICLLALLTTAISSFVYGLLFYAVAYLFQIPMDIWTCILLGCVVSPTDPIAATGILSKIGLSKNVCSVIENESLFNDGTGVTLFVFVRSVVIHSGESNFAVLMFREIVGAVAVALLVSFVLFRIIKLTKNSVSYILISLFDVAVVYMICEPLGFSGVIASVVCGMYFSYAMDKIDRRVSVIDPKGYYKDFWEIIENILNAILFVMIGLYVLDVEISSFAPVVIPAAILIILLSRIIGVYVSSVLSGRKIPGNYSLWEYVTLMVWSALKGGLSLALAIQTQSYLDPEVYKIFINVTYVTIFFTVLAQGLSIKKVYFMLEKHKAQRLHQKRG